MNFKNDIQIAVSLDIRRRSTQHALIDGCSRQFRFVGHIRERRRTVLLEETQTTIACKHQISFEVVTEIDRQHPIVPGRAVIWPTGKWKYRTARQANLAACASRNNGCALSIQRDCADPLCPVCAWYLFRFEVNRCIGWRS